MGRGRQVRNKHGKSVYSLWHKNGIEKKKSKTDFHNILAARLKKGMQDQKHFHLKLTNTLRAVLTSRHKRIQRNRTNPKRNQIKNMVNFTSGEGEGPNITYRSLPQSVV